MTTTRPRLSGFCTGPIGARPQCARCVAHGAVSECPRCAGLRAEQGQSARETGRIGDEAKGRIARTNPTLLATISTEPKGA